jgi:hypothetical protein
MSIAHVTSMACAVPVARSYGNERTGNMTDYPEIAADLGMDEIERRISALSAYNRYETIAAIYGTRTDDGGLTAVQLEAWAKFARTLGDGILVDAQSIKRPKTAEELAETVLSTEHYARRSAERKAAEADAA